MRCTPALAWKRARISLDVMLCCNSILLFILRAMENSRTLVDEGGLGIFILSYAPDFFHNIHLRDEPKRAA
ncbi:hypothetical protein SISSUDRAFT_1067933 [Sistotremastrum suecicum HHB10207 ss-3]|uniref:Uncharacterized protein n=1 Tax=Sistotremastrum suecicum HHB10207 ss-3 TaxID=1314776 RepID=A0A165WJU7_9AGAM|nr:hypothetical protein SISSUDRAFT_1067933 [Sistotremastrum suecicum HHB10207 ss-3]